MPGAGDGRPTCQRPDCCGAVYQDHAPGGGACLVWDPETGWHCPCRGFQWVALPAAPAPCCSHHAAVRAEYYGSEASGQA